MACDFPACKYVYAKGSGISIHRVPADDSVWVAELFRITPANKRSLSLCSDHFKSDAFKLSKTGTKTLLRNDVDFRELLKLPQTTPPAESRQSKPVNKPGRRFMNHAVKAKLPLCAILSGQRRRARSLPPSDLSRPSDETNDGGSDSEESSEDEAATVAATQVETRDQTEDVDSENYKLRYEQTQAELDAKTAELQAARLIIVDLQKRLSDQPSDNGTRTQVQALPEPIVDLVSLKTSFRRELTDKQTKINELQALLDNSRERMIELELNLKFHLERSKRVKAHNEMLIRQRQEILNLLDRSTEWPVASFDDEHASPSPRRLIRRSIEPKTPRKRQRVEDDIVPPVIELIETDSDI